MIAQVAVSDCVYAIDRPYSYRIPDGLTLQPGMRVLVPFGNGNRKKEAVVLAVSAGEEAKLKAVEQALDEEPVLTTEQLRLAGFLRERYFCTYYDAVKAILPAGLWFRRQETFALTPEAADMPEDGSLAGQLVQFLRELGGSATDAALRQRFPDEEQLALTIKTLKAKKMLTSSLDLTRRGGVKTQKLAALAVPAEDAMDFARRKQRAAPLQKAVLELLCAVGSGSAQEICELTGASMPTLRRLEKLELITISEQPVFRQAVRIAPQTEPMRLNKEQSAAVEGLWTQAQREKPGAALLYGVTGSGKTAVYMELIARTLAEGQSAVLLVPEIALTPQMLRRFTAQFGSDVAMLHSALPLTERYDQWKRIRRGEVRVVLGTRSAVFAPLQNLGLIILDEEQETSYQSENPPRYHARDVAQFRCAQNDALLLLGSATPTIETAYAAKNGRYQVFSLHKRFNDLPLPKVLIADMKDELRQGNETSIGHALRAELEKNIERGEQSILFLNRRGSARMLLCGECGYVPQCPRCSVPMTYHSANERLMCHYCGHSEAVVDKCSECGGLMKRVGSGTQKVEQELFDLFPKTKVLRMDADTVGASRGHEALLREFEEKNIPILLGTQMVAKGLDFENVTLVGVVDADMSLYVDNFRAAETTFSLITQVVGRAGRGAASGTAVIQTMAPEHPVLQLAAKQDYDAFYELEIKIRTLRGFPPLRDIFLLTFTGMHEDQVMRAAARFRDRLSASLTQDAELCEALLLGPSPAPVARVNYTYRYRLTLSCKNSRKLRQLLSQHLRMFFTEKENKGVSAFADVNSYD
mgnify:CR=1 FL=1